MTYCIFDITFGTEILAPGTEPLVLPYSKDRVSGEDSECTRLGRSQFKACIFHTNNRAGYGSVCEVLKSMYKDVLLNRVDLVAGDGNKHTQFHSPSHQRKCQEQGFLELQNSLIHLSARAFFSHYNEGLPFTSRIQVQLFDNNSFLTGNSAQADVDCMLAQVISYGTSPGSFAARQDLRQNLMRIMKAAWYPSPEGPPGNLAESLLWTEKNSIAFFKDLAQFEEYLSTDDLIWLSGNSPLSPALIAPQDFLIKLSERVKHLERPDLWLGEKDTDWHIPILLTIREHAYRNWRKRGSEGTAKREEKKSKSRSWSSSSSWWRQW